MRVYCLTAALLVASLVSPAAAQSVAGRAVGTVTDTAGKPIKGAVITATNPDASPSQVTSTSDEKGRWSMIGLRTAAVWAFAVEAPGYSRASSNAPIRSGNGVAPLAFVLQRSPEPFPDALARDIVQQVEAARAMRAAGRYDQALSAYESIQGKNARLTLVQLAIADLYRAKAEHETGAPRDALYERAIVAYAELLKSEPDNARAKLELAATLKAVGQRDAALRTLRELAAANLDVTTAREAAASLHELE